MCYRCMLLVTAVSPPSPHKEEIFLCTHFLHEVLKQLYLEKNEQLFQNKREAMYKTFLITKTH